MYRGFGAYLLLLSFYVFDIEALNVMDYSTNREKILACKTFLQNKIESYHNL